MLTDFLENLGKLNRDKLNVGYYFLVNDSKDKSLETVWRTVIGDDIDNPRWQGAVVGVLETGAKEDIRAERVSRGILKNLQNLRERVRKYAIANGFDYCFFVDCDLMVQEDTLQVLMAHQKDYVAALVPNTPDGSVRYFNGATFVGMDWPDRPYTQPPGVLPGATLISGLNKIDVTGACFLMTREVMEKCTYLPTMNAREQGIFNASPGEDFAFAISCKQQGFQQYIDVDHLVYHCYNESLLSDYKKGQGNK